jgi:hypothetical protein
VARETEGQEQAEKSVDGSGEGHGDAVGSGKTVGGDTGAKRAGEKDAKMRKEKKWRPENGRTDGEMVLQVTGRRSKSGARLVILIETGTAETFIGVTVIFCKIEIVLDEGGARKSVIANTIAANPRV